MPVFLDNALQKLICVFGYMMFFVLNRINLRLLLPGIGNLIEAWRQVALRIMGANIGDNSFIRSGAIIHAPQNLKIGRNCRINIQSKMFLFEQFVVGDDVIIGPELLVYTGDHVIHTSNVKFIEQKKYNKSIIIEDDVYIGARVTLLKGSYIENRVVVAAGAVVAGRLESGYIYGGVPAKKIGRLIT